MSDQENPTLAQQSTLEVIFYYQKPPKFGQLNRTLRIWSSDLRFGFDREMAKTLSSTLFVSRLSSYINKEKLKQMFSPFGDVTEARLIIDRETRRPKGFGFVTYKSEVEAQKALKVMDGRMVDGRLIFVEVAKPERLPDDISSR